MTTPYYSNLQKFTQWPRGSFLEPFSTKSQPFTEWSRQPYSFLNDDFCHSKPFTAKINASTGRSSLKMKQSVSEKKGNLQLEDEVKLWFDLPTHGYFYAKVKSTDYLKIQYDHGLRSFNGHYYYLFGGINTNRLLNNLSLRLGVGIIKDNYNTENRLTLTLKEKNELRWYNKTFWAYKQARFGFISVIDLNKTVFQKNNLLFGYHPRDDTAVYFRAEVNGFRQANPELKRLDTIFDSFTADFIHTINNKSKTAVEAKFNLKEWKLDEAKAVYQFEYAAKKVIKASINNKLNFALLTKGPLYGLEDIASFSAGLGVNGICSKEINVKTGFEVSVNL